MAKIKLFTDWEYMPSKQTHPAFVIQPPWQNKFGTELTLKDKSEFSEVNRFGSLLANWGKYFEITDKITDADYVVLPSDWKYYIREGQISKGFSFLKQMSDFNKKIVIQYNSDDDGHLDFPSVDHKLLVITRTSFNKSKQMFNEYALPGFIGDPLVVYGNGKLQLREKSVKPKVGFCGWASTTSMSEKELSYFSDLVDVGFSNSNLSLENQANLIYSFRGSVLNYLQQDNTIDTDFIFRKGYCAGINRENDIAGLVQVRQEYYSNILNNDYVVCIRGKGNYSYRFYETLSFGRIPIFINTDSPLPFQDSVDWNKHCVQINHNEIKDIGEIVSNHYNSLSAEQLRNFKIENRSFWENTLIPERYFANLLSRLSNEGTK